MMLNLISILLLASCFCFATGDSSPAPEDQQPTWRDVIERHLKEKPKAQADDVYKLIYQGVMGPGHMVSSEKAALDYIEKEMSSLTAIEFTELAFEPISPDGSMVRVNLRPFVAQGGDLKKLARAFYLSARQIDPDKRRGQFALHWMEVSTGLIEAGKLDKAEVEKLTAQARENGWPAVHHSDTYREAYRPAYRVVLLELLKKEQPELFPPQAH